MPRKHISLVAVPPSHERIRYFRVRLSILIVLTIILMVGIAGFFLPFNTLSLDVVEINQHRNLTLQNKKLLSRIRVMRESFLVLKKKIDTLGRTRNAIDDLIDIEEQALVADTSIKELVTKMGLDKLQEYVDGTESFYSEFAEKVTKNPAYLDYVPVLRPVSEDYVITARYGKRKDPFTGDMKWHNGIDFSAERETPVIAAASGIVDKVENSNYWGRLVRIQHRFGFNTVYAHLGTVNVVRGKQVRKGDIIATIGISGLSTGPHLHYEIYRNAASVNPELYFYPDTLLVANK